MSLKSTTLKKVLCSWKHDMNNHSRNQLKDVYLVYNLFIFLLVLANWHTVRVKTIFSKNFTSNHSLGGILLKHLLKHEWGLSLSFLNGTQTTTPPCL